MVRLPGLLEEGPVKEGMEFMSIRGTMVVLLVEGLAASKEDSLIEIFKFIGSVMTGEDTQIKRLFKRSETFRALIGKEIKGDEGELLNELPSQLILTDGEIASTTIVIAEIIGVLYDSKVK